MDIESRLEISYYKTVADINPEHGIYLAQHVETKKVYVKKILKVYNPDIYNRLKDMPVLGMPRIHALHEETGELTVIEEYISGNTLEELFEQNIKFDCAEIMRIISALCDILERLHRLNPPIIHRDIKPSNVMLTPDGRIILLDMNAARYMDREKDEDTELLGTKGYAAPEQYGFGTSDERTDIYAIGMLLKELLRDNYIENQAERNRLSAIADRCTELNPRDRFSSVAELRESLNFFGEAKTMGNEAIANDVAEDKAAAGSKRSFLPPGFRTLNPLKMITAILGYALIFYMSFTVEFDTATLAGLYVERFFCLLIFMLTILFSCNYLNVQRYFPLCRSRNIVVRILGVVLADIIIIFVLLMIMVLVIMLIER